MQSDSLTTEINGRKYRTNKYNPRESLRLMNTLGRLMGGPLGNAAGAVTDGDSSRSLTGMAQSFDGEAFGDAITTLFREMEEADPAAVADRILAETHVVVGEGDQASWEKVDIDQHFRGNLFDVFEVCAWVLKVNYSNFFDRLASFGGAQLEDLIARFQPENESGSEI